MPKENVEMKKGGHETYCSCNALHRDDAKEEAEDAVFNIRDVRFRLVVANDYRIEATSNRSALR